MPRKVKPADLTAQNRESQRRSRARRKELMAQLSGELAQYKSHGVTASVAMQAAARAVSVENRRLRALLGLHGISEDQINLHLATPEPTTAIPAAAVVATIVPKGDAVRSEDPAAAQATGHRPSSASTRSRSKGNAAGDGTPHAQSSSQACPPPSSTRLAVAGGTTPTPSIAVRDAPLLAPAQPVSPRVTRSSHKQASPQFGDDVYDMLQTQDPSLDWPQTVHNRPSSVPACYIAPQPGPSVADQGSKRGLETSCDEAAAILVQLQSKPDPAQARAALGCVGPKSCFAKNSTIFQLMDELG